MFSRKMNIADFDPVVWDAINAEDSRQEDHIELIASENYTSPRVMEAQGTQLTNKYAEGYPGKRSTVAVSMLISLNNLLSTAQKNYSVQVTLTYNLTQAHKQTPLCTFLYVNQATPF